MKLREGTSRFRRLRLRLLATVTVWALCAAVFGPAGLAMKAASASEGGSDGAGPVLVVANAASLSDVGTAASLVAAGLGDAVVFSEATDALGSGPAGVVSQRAPARVLLVGGAAVLSSSVEQQVRALAPGVAIERLAGDDRIHTAALAAERILDGRDAATVVMANGWSLSDVGTAASAVASGRGDAVLYAQADALGEPTRAVLEGHRPSAVLIVGGAAALSDGVAAEAERAAGGVLPRRLGGATRVETAALSAREAFDAGATVAVIADGWSLNDVGVAAAISASMDRSAVLYAADGDLGDAGADLFADRPPSAVLLVDVSGKNPYGLLLEVAGLVPDAAVGVIADRVQSADYRRDAVADASASVTALGGEAEAVPLAGRISVSWPEGEAVADSSQPGYEVQWRTAVTTYNSTDRVVVTTTSFDIDGLNDGTDYTVRVRPAAVDVLSVAGATVTAAAEAAPTARVVDGPAPVDESLEVSALDGPLSVELTGEEVWPVTVEIPVDAAKIEPGDSVGLYYYDENLELWFPEPSATYDPQRSTVTAQVYHLTIFNPFKIPANWIADRWNQLTGFARQSWDTTTGWLRAGWHRTQDFIFSDVPSLAGQVLAHAAAVGHHLPPWVIRVLEQARDLGAEVVEIYVQAIQEVFETRIDPPKCDSASPDWVHGIDVEADDGRNDPEDIPLLVCGETTTPIPTTRDDLRLKVGMNRGFAMTLSAYAPDGTHQPIRSQHAASEVLTFAGYEGGASSTGLSTWAINQLVEFFDTGEVILPGGEVALIHAPQAGFGEHGSLTFRAEADHLHATLDAIAFGLDTLASTFGNEQLVKFLADFKDGLSCIKDGILADNDDVIAKVRSLFFDCLPMYAKDALGSTFGKFLDAGSILYSGASLLVNYAEMTRYTFTGDTEDFTVTRTSGAPGEGSETDTESDDDPLASYRTVSAGSVGSFFGPTGGTDLGGVCMLRADSHVDCRAIGNDLASLDESVRTQFVDMFNAPDGPFTEVGVGTLTACGLRLNGSIACWGSHHPGQVRGIPDGTFTTLDMAGSQACAVRSDREIKCWGEFAILSNEDYGQAEPPAGAFTDIAVGAYHACGIRVGGSVVCWGAPPSQSDVLQVPSGSFEAIAAGHFYTCGLRSDSTAECWGSEDSGMLTSPPPGPFTTISAGVGHACGLRPNGVAECWGYGFHGEPDAPAGRFISVSSGASFSCGIRVDGTLQCWGRFQS
ncbi:cell wall-binding repeat-containing protein [Candidatus Poriferisodalis sp.]|uniref:cell wall-binding repeat-containing protein n=1 Tax=Candidatus Poriferisodalis sp. TaxID=3101277 RepID=UPI003AF52C44